MKDIFIVLLLVVSVLVAVWFVFGDSLENSMQAKADELFGVLPAQTEAAVESVVAPEGIVLEKEAVVLPEDVVEEVVAPVESAEEVVAPVEESTDSVEPAEEVSSEEPEMLLPLLPMVL